MARYIYQGTTEDQNGVIIPSATVFVFEAGGSTPANIYTASSGGAAVNSVTSDSNGFFSFYVDDTDYSSNQLFKITISKTGFSEQDQDDIDILELGSIVQDTSGNLGVGGVTPVSALTLPLENDAVTPTLSFGDGDTGMYEVADDTIGFATSSNVRVYIVNNGLFMPRGGGGAMLLLEDTSSTNPVVLPSHLDLDTGIGRAAADELSLIAGGIESVNISNSGVSIPGTLAITGSTTMGALAASGWPSFNAYKSAVQTNVTGIEKIEFDTEEFDTNSDFDATTNYRFTPTAAGKYIITVIISWTNYTAGDQVELYLYKNGAAYKEVKQVPDTPSHGQTLSVVVDANGSTDYFEVFGQNSARNTSTIGGSNSRQSSFTGCRIG